MVEGLTFALQQDPGVRGEIRAKVAGLLKQAKKGRTVFGLLCCKAVFGPCEAVARSLQSAECYKVQVPGLCGLFLFLVRSPSILSCKCRDALSMLLGS